MLKKMIQEEEEEEEEDASDSDWLRPQEGLPQKHPGPWELDDYLNHYLLRQDFSHVHRLADVTRAIVGPVVAAGLGRD